MTYGRSKPENQLTPVHPLLRMQQSIGNQAVGRLIQAKLQISQPGDAYEQEADRVADHVMRMPEPRVQRTCAACEGGATPCPSCGEKGPVAQRKADYRNNATGNSVPNDSLQNLGSGRKLDTATRAFFEPRFGADFRNVRVHDDDRAAESAKGVNALGYTLGRDLVFASGQYAPATTEGRRLIAHELAHVVQQHGESSDLQIRRTIGDVNDLSSPRFKGDPVLEAVFDNERLLKFGDQEPVAIVKVQQALIDAGFPIPSGPTGNFLSETKAAVIAFQTAAGLESRQVDGIIGLNTMSRLDSRFPTTVAPAPSTDCQQGFKTVTVDTVSLRDATGDPLGDLSLANDVFRQCCVQFVLGTGITAAPDVSDRFLGGDTDLQMADCGNASLEELSMFLGATSAFGLSSRIRVFYVASMTPIAQGRANAPLCATGARAALRDMVVVMNGHDQKALAHEFGHILMNTFAEHSVRSDNLMHIGRGATGNRLEPVQCAIIFSRA